MSRNGKRWIGLAAVVVVLALPFLLGRGGDSDAKEVQTEAAAARQVRASILASGNLVFREQAELSPEVIGRVSAILVEEGDLVQAGQVVLQLDERVFRAEVEQQEASVRQQRIGIERQQLNVDNQRRKFQRVQEIHARGLVDQNSFEDARHALEMAEVELRASGQSLQQTEAMLSQSRERLGRTEIRAPIGGTVVAVHIEVGETAVASSTGIAGSSLMTIADTATLMTEVNVDEADIARVAVGQDVSVFAAAFPDSALAGKVESIPLAPRASGMGAAAQANASLARSYSVKVRLDDPTALALRPGMTCRAEIYTDSAAEALAVPVQAVFSNNEAATEVAPGKEPPKEEHFLFVAVDGKAERRVVGIGVSDDSHQEITAGLKAGEQVVVGPYKVLRHLKDGEAVRPEEPADDEADGDSGTAAS